MSKEHNDDITRDMRVSKLRNGVVIDHLKPGTAMKVIELLGVVDGSILSIGMFFESKKIGRKDIVKIENRVLSEEDHHRLAFLSPEATVSVIQEYAVTSKQLVCLPEAVQGIIRCINPKCITNHEKVATRFKVESKSPLKVRCGYCERYMAGDEITFL